MKRFKLNILDIVVLLIILSGLTFAGYKFFYKPVAEDANFSPYTVEAIVMHLFPEVVTNIFLGDKLIDSTGRELMEIIEIEVGDSYSTVFAADGKIHWSKHPLLKSVRIEAKVLVPTPSGTLMYNRVPVKAGNRVLFETNRVRLEFLILSVNPSQ